MVEITLRRTVDLAVFRLTDSLQPSDISDQPLKKFVPWAVGEEEERRQRFADLVDRLESAQDPEERKRIRLQLNRLILGA